LERPRRGEKLAPTMRSVLAAALAASSLLGCSGPASSEALFDGGGDESPAHGDGAAACPLCTTDQDCAGDACVQLGADSYCAPACGSGDACAADRTCATAASYSGKSVRVCVPRGGECGVASSGHDGGAMVDAAVMYDAGTTPVTGHVGPGGGTLSRLLFAAVGDTRPANYDDTAGYPTNVITKIYADIQAQSPRPAFVVSTGDYMFASSGSSSTASAQLDIYTQARAGYSGVVFPAMGNHECTGAVASNCGSGATNGVTANYTAFLDKMLAPIQKTDPYYAIEVDAADKSWTAKFVFVAANAWSSAQSTWLAATLAKPTTYTFVIRHEPASANTAPGVSPSEQLMTQYGYTLAIVGHTHSYGHYPDTPKQALVGNGGAPLTSKDYGYAIFSQRSDGAIVGDMINWNTGAADSYFHFAVKPDGTLTQ
jgi:hypothetical protein